MDITKEIKELFLSNNDDDIRLALLMSKELGISLEDIDIFVAELYIADEGKTDKPRNIDVISEDYIVFKDDTINYKSVMLKYESWKIQ